MNGDLLFPSDLSPLCDGRRSWQGCGWGGRIQQIGNSGVISGGGDGQGLRGLPEHVRVRDRLEISQRSSTPGADCSYFGCSPEASRVLSWSWGAAIHFQPCLCPQSHLGPAGGWLGRQDTARTGFCSLPAPGSVCVSVPRQGSPGPCPRPCSLGLGCVHGRAHWQGHSSYFCIFPFASAAPDRALSRCWGM